MMMRYLRAALSEARRNFTERMGSIGALLILSGPFADIPQGTSSCFTVAFVLFVGAVLRDEIRKQG